MTMPKEHEFASQVAYARALEEYCEKQTAELEAARAEVELERTSCQQTERLLHNQAETIAAQQARIEQLREAISAFPYGQHALVQGKECSCPVCEAMRGKVKALSTPDDLSALRAHDEKLLAANTQAAKDMLAERERQKSVEGWTYEHDDQHRKGALAAAGGCYALFSDYYLAAGNPPEFWPWDAKWWKPSLARRNLIKAGALILAEIERLDRTEAIEKGGAK